MGRWQVLAIIVALTIATIPVVAQDDYRPTGPEMPAIPGDTAQLYEDVLLLRTIRTLSLSTPQLTQLRQINAGVLRQREELVDLRQSMWAEYQDEIEDVLEAWMAGEAPSSRDRSAADRAVNRVNDARADLRDARWSAAERLYDVLSGEQRGLVESPGVAEARSARIQRMAGTQSVGQYMLTQIDAIRDLMPDEFEMLAASEAHRIAQAIVGPNANTLPQVSDRVLDWLLEAYAWTPDQYRQRREQIPAQIERSLGITPETERPPVEWEDLLRLVSSARTPAVIAEITTAGGGEAE